MSEKTEVSKSTYDSKEYEKQRAEEKKRRYENKRQQLKNQRDRLDKAIISMRLENEDYKTLKNDVDALVGEKRDWTGKQKTAIQNKQGSDAVYFTNDTYKYRINKALDDLITARDNINQEYSNYGTWLEQVIADIQSIGAWLDTHFFNN